MKLLAILLSFNIMDIYVPMGADISTTHKK